MGDVRNLGGEKGTRKEKERELVAETPKEASRCPADKFLVFLFIFFGSKVWVLSFWPSALEMTKLPIWLCCAVIFPPSVVPRGWASDAGSTLNRCLVGGLHMCEQECNFISVLKLLKPEVVVLETTFK